jgi:hypothetical protein
LLVTEPESPAAELFRLFAQPDATFALAGEVDRFARSSFARTLEQVLPPTPEGPLVVDARLLEFIDHHGLHTLASAARRRGTTVVLRIRPQSATPELVRVLGLSDRIVAEVA